MAQPTNILSVFDIGPIAGSSNKESVFEAIQNIAPWDTPWFSSAPKVGVNLITFEWLTDTLAAAATGGSEEGVIVTAGARANRVRRLNNTQIFLSGIDVSDSQIAASPYGISGEYPYQVALVMRELARNIESRAWTNTNIERTAPTAAESTVRITAGLRATGWGSPVETAVNGAITTAAVENTFEAVALRGGNPDKLFLSLGVKSDFSQAAQSSGGTNRLFNIAVTDKRLVANVTVYEGNHGTLTVVPDKFIGQSAATADGHAAGLIETARMKVGMYRPMKHVPLAKVSDSTRGYVVTELGFINLHASAHGFLTGLTT